MKWEDVVKEHTEQLGGGTDRKARETDRDGRNAGCTTGKRNRGRDNQKKKKKKIGNDKGEYRLDGLCSMLSVRGQKIHHDTNMFIENVVEKCSLQKRNLQFLF
ncbi:Hypothetical protein CINCED_3A012250 [Cinara cedri]|uniref:Uncharacterized protein n=1 Tax=Cinara cedri TaxID=506608 RepID=A0A5E4MYL4_9HEMI|nr:Hypothetical protein CINCED_3A012250 [Cinara cedri]